MADITLPVIAWREYKYVKATKEDEDDVDTRPATGVEVLAYNSNWIDPMTNPKGIRIGFRNKQGGFTMSKFNGNYYKNLNYSGDDFDIDYGGVKYFNKAQASGDTVTFNKGTRPNLPEYWAPIPAFVKPTTTATGGSHATVTSGNAVVNVELDTGKLTISDATLRQVNVVQ